MLFSLLFDLEFCHFLNYSRFLGLVLDGNGREVLGMTCLLYENVRTVFLLSPFSFEEGEERRK